MQAQELVIKDDYLAYRPRLGELEVRLSNGKFKVLKNNKVYPVNTRNVSPKLRELVRTNSLDRALNYATVYVEEVEADGPVYYSLNIHYNYNYYNN